MDEVKSQPLDGDPAARVIVAGASGLTGSLAADLLWRHPRFELAAVTARAEAGSRLDEVHPVRRVPMVLREFEDLDLTEVDAAIVAYPHAAAAPVVASLTEAGVRVCDLSADFRISDLSTYEYWYGDHPAPELLQRAVYGLPEINRKRIAGAQIVANPGCYPTATLLSLLPLAEAGLLADVVVDAKSGVSGAGRPTSEDLGFINVDENVRPYGLGGHRHHPEISEQMTMMGGTKVPLTFVPHLLPLDQGELVSCYLRLTKEIPQDRLAEMYRERFANEPFVEVLDRPPGVREVRDTNLCRVHALPAVDGEMTLVFGAIDNLWKGASSQAVQNLNLMFGLDEGEGIS